MDIILLYLPILIYGSFLIRSWKGVLVVFAGFTPFFLWEIFSLIYYGFPFPNTAYAKLNTNAGNIVLVEQGLYYLQSSLKLDPITLLSIGIGLMIPCLTKEKKYLPMMAGTGLYLIYVVKIGGGFMSGRFLTAPLFTSVVIISNSQLTTMSLLPGKILNLLGIRQKLPFSEAWIALVIIVLVVGLSSAYSPIYNDKDYSKVAAGKDARGISDERGSYYETTGLLLSGGTDKTNELRSIFSTKIKRLTDGKQIPDQPVGTIGLIGFSAGPDIYIIDKYALAEPLLARLTPISPDLREVDTRPELAELGYRPGHLRRLIPKGLLRNIGHRRK